MLRCVFRNETDASVVQKTWLGKYKDGLIKACPWKTRRCISSGCAQTTSSCLGVLARPLRYPCRPLGWACGLWIVLGNVPNTSSRHMASDLVP